MSIAGYAAEIIHGARKMPESNAFPREEIWEYWLLRTLDSAKGIHRMFFYPRSGTYQLEISPHPLTGILALPDAELSPMVDSLIQVSSNHIHDV